MCTRPDCFRLIADTDIRRTAGRDRHGKSNFASLPFPFARNQAPYRMILTFRPIHSFHKMRRNQNMAETWFNSIVVDTSKLIHHPSRDISHKDMIQGGVAELRT